MPIVRAFIELPIWWQQEHLHSESPFARYFVKMCNDIDFYRWNRSRSNANMSTERAYSCPYFMAIVLFALSGTNFDILTVEMCMNLTFTMGQGQMYFKQIERTYSISHLIAILVCLSYLLQLIQNYHLQDIHKSNKISKVWHWKLKKRSTWTKIELMPFDCECLILQNIVGFFWNFC